MWVRVFAICAIMTRLGGGGLAANRPPQAELLVVDVSPGTSIAVTVSATDPDGDALTFSVLGGPHHGRLQGTAPHLTYIPEPGFVGMDDFTFVVVDPYGALDVGMARLRVTLGITTYWVGPEARSPFSVGPAELATRLANEGVHMWYIFTQTGGPFSAGQEIVVLLSSEGDVGSVTLFQLVEGISPLSVFWSWDPRGWLRVTVPPDPGSYFLTVVKGQQAFSFLVQVKGIPGESPKVAVAGRGER